MTSRKHPTFTAEYRAEVVNLVRKGDKGVPQLARDLGISETALRRWVKVAEVDSGNSPTGALTTEERAELARVRRELAQVKMERDFLKKAAAFFAKETV
jgi:transposase